MNHMTKTRWELPTTDVAMANWIAGLFPEDLDHFISDAEYLLDVEKDTKVAGPESWTVLAVVLGAARQWRDNEIDPLQTIRTCATAGFYVEELVA